MRLGTFGNNTLYLDNINILTKKKYIFVIYNSQAFQNVYTFLGFALITRR